MPTIFSHGAVGFVAARLGLRSEEADRPIVIASIIVAAVPDLDALFMRWIRYGDPLGHRGFSHSLLFAVLLGFSLALVFVKAGWAGNYSFWRLAALFSLVTASHGFFDALTDGGLGVAFFSPFDNSRYFFPWRPIPVAPLSVDGLLTPRVMRLMAWEAALFGVFVVAAAVWDRRTIWRKVTAYACAAVGILAWVLVLI